MLRLFQLLFLGHIHKWNIIDQGKAVDDNKDIIGSWYILQCEHCGNIKRKNTRAW